MFRIAICDDKKVILDRVCDIIKQFLKNENQNFKLDSFESGVDLLCEKKYQLYDIIFLDIDMPIISGFDVAKKIREDSYDTYIIFLTSYSEYMQDSFDYQPFFYILKNNEDSLRSTIASTLKKIEKRMLQNKKIILGDNGCRKCVVSICDILYVEVTQHHLDFCILNKPERITQRGIMSGCEEEYSAYGFVRIHKKYLVNLRHVDYIDLKLDEIVLYNKQRLPMSRNYRKNVNEKYTMYLRSKI